jgi:hypothetical protein
MPSPTENMSIGGALVTPLKYENGARFQRAAPDVAGPLSLSTQATGRGTIN